MGGLEPAVPGSRWGAAVLGALALVVVAVAGVEIAWRAAGHTPTVVDSPDLWAYERARVGRAGRSAVVLAGSSRMQLDVDTERFRRRLPDVDLIHLAIDDSQPVAVLRDLAADSSFVGTVVVDITTWGLSRAAWEGQAGHVDHYHRRSTIDRRLNARLGALVRSRLAILNPQVELLDILREGRPGDPFYLQTLPDRSRKADFTRVDLAAHREFRTRGLMGQPTAPRAETWLEEALAVDALAQRIGARGGVVVFVRLPSSGASWEYTEATYPKALFWDRFAARAAGTVIHFKDVPAMADLECPDYSHLDRRDTTRFTDALVDELIARGVLAGPGRGAPASS